MCAQLSHPPTPGAPRRALYPWRVPSNSLYIFLEGVAKVALYCAHRTSTFLSCAFCEQEGHLAAPLPLLQSAEEGVPREAQERKGACFPQHDAETERARRSSPVFAPGIRPVGLDIGVRLLSLLGLAEPLASHSHVELGCSRV